MNGKPLRHGLRWQRAVALSRPQAFSGGRAALVATPLLCLVVLLIPLSDSISFVPSIFPVTATALNLFVMVLAGWWLSLIACILVFTFFAATTVADAFVLSQTGRSGAVIALIVIGAIAMSAVHSTASAAYGRQLFIRFLADQVRSPITLIGGYLDLYDAGAVSADEAVRTIRRATATMNTMVHDALEKGERVTDTDLWVPPARSTPAPGDPAGAAPAGRSLR